MNLHSHLCTSLLTKHHRPKDSDDGDGGDARRRRLPKLDYLLAVMIS